MDTKVENVSSVSHVVVTNNAGEVILSNGRVMLQNKITGDLLSAPLNETIREVFHLAIVSEETPEQCELDGEELSSPTLAEEGSEKLWTQNTTVFLIQKIKEMGDRFDSGIKKSVYSTLATNLQKEFNKPFTSMQIESKWKALKRTYKSILLHNNTTGKQRRRWEYFDLVHEFLHKKPEINPPATCSNIAGLKVLNSDGCTSETPEQPEPSSSCKLESSFSKKRKQRVSEASKRHAEKMVRLDTFNDLFKQMVEKM